MKPRSCLPVCIHLQVGLLNFTLYFVYQSLTPANLFHILSLSINNFIPLTKSCLITRCSHCLLSSPDHLWVHWIELQPRAPLVNFPHCKDWVNSLYPVVLSWLLIHARTFSSTAWMLSLIESLLWGILCTVFWNSQVDHIYQISLFICSLILSKNSETFVRWGFPLQVPRTLPKWVIIMHVSITFY